eukprot:CAMPEP_0202975382 /NCGR_PEP_ID=MMETSP1396-20130829/68604_1 /ASSEMBLY_ACC=CAM_ASM_000872 /TAXON_ID= /ORGANISM="Pseudokeronopsis sp., Strain Brazil" /LENGTH=62 /DNA_ID=CAMNT_0049710889 /DNA_START=1 /DNA_END=185 /DNA_ORIENTATION=-
MSMSKNSLGDMSKKLVDITSIVMNQDVSSDCGQFLLSNQVQSPKLSESFLPRFNKEVLNELA